jgi:lipoate-protein ligase A
MRLLEASTPEDPSLDVAISHALLRRVADREAPATIRLYRPGPTVAFGRLDALRDGFAAATRAARAQGFAPVLRSVGGHAAAYTSAAIVYEEITPQDRLAVELRERFEAMAAALAAALASLGADARVGEIPGEYCPGEFSVNAGGTLKLAGIAQRVTSRAALVSAVVVIAAGDRVRAVLRDVNARLGLDWEPRTAGALDDVVPGVDGGAVRDGLVAQRSRAVDLERAELDPETVALARTLQARHRLA